MTALFGAILKISLGTSLTALLVLTIRALLGRRPAAVMPMLYALLLLRMLLPFSVKSPLSMENLLPQPAAQAVSAFTEMPAENLPAQPQTSLSAQDTDSRDDTDAQAAGKAPLVATPALSPFEIAATIWAAGAAASALILAAMSLRFALLLRRNRPYSAPGFAALLEACKAELHLRRPITVIRFSGVNAAAVYGALRPRLLICPQRFEALSEAEKRSVLLHELAHIRRGDTAACLLLGAAGALHWFNPLALLALVLMRRDMEAFCDAAVLKTLNEAGRREYARTLMKLSGDPPMHFNPVLSMSRISIKRRIVMASRYKRNTPLHVALALLLTLVIAAAGCTSAAETQSVQPAQPSVTASPAESPSEQVSSSQVEPGEDIDPLDYMIFSTGGYGECIWQIPLDTFEDGNVANIQKAAQRLDGTVIAYGDSVDLMVLLGSVTEADGWATATERSWTMLYDNILPDPDTEPDVTILAPGGGAEILLNVLAEGAAALGCDVAAEAEVYTIGSDNPPAVTDTFELIIGGNLTITNTEFEEGLELRAEVHGNMLVVAVRDAGLPYSKPSLLSNSD